MSYDEWGEDAQEQIEEIATDLETSFKHLNRQYGSREYHEPADVAVVYFSKVLPEKIDFREAVEQQPGDTDPQEQIDGYLNMMGGDGDGFYGALSGMMDGIFGGQDADAFYDMMTAQMRQAAPMAVFDATYRCMVMDAFNLLEDEDQIRGRVQDGRPAYKWVGEN